MYDETRLSKSAATFDTKKLDWINNQYVKSSDEDEVVDLALRQLIQAGNLPKNPDTKTIEWARQLINLYKQQMSYMAQINDMASVFFNEPDQVSGETLEEISNETAPVVLKEFSERVQNLEIFDKVEILKTIKDIQKATGIRVVNFGCQSELRLPMKCMDQNCQNQSELVGRETTLKHVQQTLDQIK